MLSFFVILFPLLFYLFLNEQQQVSQQQQKQQQKLSRNQRLSFIVFLQRLFVYLFIHSVAVFVWKKSPN